MSFVNQDGLPSVITKADSTIVEMGLRKALEQYLEQLAAQEIELNFPNDFGGEETSLTFKLVVLRCKNDLFFTNLNSI